MYRQGDILLIPTTEQLPADAQPIKREHGRLVLAHGEATGHAHTVTSRKAILYDAPSIQVSDLSVRLLAAEAEAILLHQEHAPVAIPAGTYRVVRQREYSPEAIRNVSD